MSGDDWSQSFGGGTPGPAGPKGDKGDTGDTGPTGATGATGAAGADGADGQGFRDGQTIFTGPCTPALTATMASGTAYFTYIGYFPEEVTINYVRLVVTANGSGAQTAEVGLFSTTTGPDGTAKSFTKIVATGSVNSLTSGSTFRAVTNTSALGQVISAGTHLWSGVRSACASSQPTAPSIPAAANPTYGGICQSTSASGALTGAGPFAGALISAGTATCTSIST